MSTTDHTSDPMADRWEALTQAIRAERDARLGRSDYRNLVMFTSLSKRSNAPGLRSGFVCGDAEVLAKFLLYRTYHGSAMSAVVQAASRAAEAARHEDSASLDVALQQMQAVEAAVEPVPQ